MREIALQENDELSNETNETLLCIELIIVYVFQPKPNLFRLIEVINGVTSFFQTNLLLSLISILQVDALI